MKLSKNHANIPLVHQLQAHSWEEYSPTGYLGDGASTSSKPSIAPASFGIYD